LLAHLADDPLSARWLDGLPPMRFTDTHVHLACAASMLTEFERPALSST
jgi:hypothetical protein